VCASYLTNFICKCTFFALSRACVRCERCNPPPRARTLTPLTIHPGLTHMDRQNSSSSTCATPHANPPCHAQPPPARARAHLPAQNAHAHSLHASHTHMSFVPAPKEPMGRLYSGCALVGSTCGSARRPAAMAGQHIRCILHVHARTQFCGRTYVTCAC